MSGWEAKRFWTDVTVAKLGNGYAIQLDGRPVRTPAKNPLALPTRALAKVIEATRSIVIGVAGGV